MSSRLGASRSGESAGSGSFAKTSSAAPASVPGAQRLDERRLVDERAARGVDEQRAGPQQREPAGVDEAARRVGHGQVQADDVAACERRLDRLGALGAQLAHALGRHVRVVGDRAHAERARPRRHQPADAAEAEQRERLVGELDAARSARAPRRRRAASAAAADVAGQREQQRERVLGGRDDVRLGRVADDDPARGRRLDVDVVDPDAGAADHAQRSGGRDQRGVDRRGRAHDERVGVASAAARSAPGLELDDLAGLAQQLQARVGDRLGDDAARYAGLLIAATQRQRRRPARELRSSAEASSVAPRCPKRSTLPAMRPPAALDDVAGPSSTAWRSVVGVGALGHADRGHERARLVVGREQLEARARARGAEAPRQLARALPDRLEALARARGRAPRRARSRSRSRA